LLCLPLHAANDEADVILGTSCNNLTSARLDVVGKLVTMIEVEDEFEEEEALFL